MQDNSTTKVTAPDIVCGGCATAIKNALSRMDGVKSVDVDVATKEVSVSHDAGVGKDKIVEALDKAGFPAA